MNTRLIMILGSSPGAGKSCLASALSTRLPELGLPVLALDEDAVWGSRQLGVDRIDRSGVWPEFRDLLHRDEPDATPGAPEIVRAFECVCARRAAIDEQAVWIQDWFWPDIATMLPTLNTQPSTLMRLSRELRRTAEPLAPVVLYLEVDTERALRRAVAERGPIWLNRHAGVDPMLPDHEARLQTLAASYRRRESSRREALHEAGWDVVYVDANGRRSAVFNDAHTALGSGHRRTAP